MVLPGARAEPKDVRALMRGVAVGRRGAGWPSICQVWPLWRVVERPFVSNGCSLVRRSSRRASWLCCAGVAGWTNGRETSSVRHKWPVWRMVQRPYASNGCSPAQSCSVFRRERWACSVPLANDGHAPCRSRTMGMLSAVCTRWACSALPQVPVLRPACSAVAGREPGEAVDDQILEITPGADPGQTELKGHSGR